MGTELWHPDITITNEFVRNMIEKQFDDLAPVKVKCIGEGWDNKVFLVNDHFIFRFPHREIAANLIERENVVLKYLQDKVDLKIPNPLYAGQPDDDYPYHFHGYQIIHGKSACHATLTASERVGSLIKLAEFLKRLHDITETKARQIGAKDQVFDRTDILRAIDFLVDRVEKIKARNIAAINPVIFEKEIQIAREIKLPAKKVLVHGDLYCRHLIFDKTKLVGIIDWGDVGINSPAVDLCVLFSFYPKSCHQKFFDIYGSIDPKTYAYARFLGLYSALTIMLYGHDIKDVQLVSEGRESIQRMNPNLIIG